MFPPVAQGGAGDRPVGDTVARAQQTTGPATTTLWPLAPAQPNQLSNQQFQGIPPLAATPAPAHNQGANRSGTLYSLFSGGGGGSYVAATPATPGQPAAARTYHKVSESVFSAAVGVGMSGYTWGAPTPPPGSYSPVPMTQLDLLKNFANLAPAAAAAAAGQQTLSLQGVGVNVAGSLHHAQHTQHTQHTLNLTGFHHLHHGGLHQNAFSPQLSLVAGSAPTLTINSFSSHNPTGNGVAPTTGVLLQEYQSPIGATAAPAGCTVTVNGSSCLTNTSSTANSMVLHGGSGGGNQATGNQTVQAATVTTKKREAFLSSQGQPVKLENKSTRTSCLCRNSNGKTKVVHSDVGCSRTLPVASSWNGQDGSAGTNNSNAASLTVKREPLASVPCQVAEVSTSLHATTTSVKIEPVPPKSENGIAVPNVGKAVGIAVARQRLQHQETSSMRNVSLSHHTSHHATNYHHFQPDSLGSGTAMTIGGTTLVHCGGPGGEDRAAHLAAIPSGALAPSLNLNSSINSALNSTLGSIGGAPAAATDAAAATWPPTLWQYSATAAAAMPTEPVGFSQMGSGLQGGFQLIRDPTTGQILVIHAAEQMQQAVVFPNYLNHSNNVIPSSLLVPPPPSSIQLLSDIGGARLVLTENKRKQQSASLPIVKIEAECSNSPTAIITSTESSKTALQTMAGALVPDALVTTLYYPQGSALVQISQAEPTAHCRSQATSPVSCLTPPPEIPATIHAIEPASFGVQDASNQTDAPEETDEHKQEPPLVKQEQNLSPCQASQSNTNLTAANFEIVRITTTTTTVNPTVCGIVAKVDKAENTIINMADAAKYLTKGSGRGFVRAIEQSSQGVKATDEDKDDKVPLCSRSRIGARIIEITEENCDSFHENLEFFARRRDVSAEQRDHRDDYSKDETDAAPNIHEKMDIESKTIDAPEKVEVHCQMCPKTPETAIFDEPKPSAVDSTESSRINCESCDKNRNIANGEDRPQIAKKSFDMPNIDCDDQEVQQVVIKQEADDNCYEVCYESSQCEPTSTSERSRSSCERLSQEATKRHSVEKTHHPGIENVVEKLKKSAAALQEATLLPVAQKIDKSTEQLDAEKLRRYSETIPKKLHFLRSCQNSLESNLDTEVSSSQTAEQHDHDQSGHSSQMEDEPSSASSKCDTSGECLINDNNNDSKSNNNNIKVLEDVKLLAMNKKNILYDTYKPKTVWRCEVHPLGKFNATRKSEVVKDDASSETIDNSGLLLLSKSIEQYEQRIGQPEHPQPDAYDAENSSVRSELQISQQSESNNVGNRLRILDLAQIASEIIESDHLEKDGNKRKYPENDDHHVKRYKIDDCKEEETNKDASFNYPEESSANKTMEIIAEQRAAESTKCTVNFSEEKINNVTDERVTDAEEKPLNEDYENYQPKKRNAKLLKDSQVLNKICLDETFDNSQNNDNYDKLSDEGSDSESRIFSGQPTSQVESKKRKASVEDARGDVHDYKNPQTKLETKKFIARKGSRDEGDWPNINAAESNIIAEMANIQKKYKETQLELFKLPPKKDDKKCFGRPRKKSHSSLSSDQGTLPSPPAYEFGSSPNSPVKLSGWIDDAFLPITSAGSIVPTNGTNLEKHISKIERKYQIEHQSHIKLLDSIPSIPTSELPIALPDPIPGPKTAEDSEKNTGTATVNSDVSSSSSAAISISASKRRKVGRPRKFKNLTETIVTKKSKSKSAIVDYVLSPKNRHLQTKQYGYTPLPFKSSMSSLRQSKLQKTKRMKQTPLHKKDVIVSSIFGDKAKKHSSGKVKPKLKAEVMMKNLNDESDTIPPENIPSEESIVQISVEETPAESVEQGMEKEPERPRHEKSKKRKRKLSQSSNSESRESKWHKNCTQCKKTAAESIIKRCKLTDEYLKQDHLRILKESNGLFYAGILSVVQPNEIYAINLDGERGNKSHILPKEDILRDAIVEVRPSSTKEILPGTRLCAYWSHNQRCLYPGISAEPINGNSAEQCEDNYVIVEFDDGDSGRISLEYIRFLLPDYPFVEYNTNPLVSCRKRRRQASASEEKRSVDNDQTAASGDEITAEAFTHERGKTKIEKLCDYHRRKKKIKKDKKLHESQEEKMKHRKHKSSKEHRKERHKHKKHRKHKHRHHDSFGDSSKTSSKESSFEQKSEEEAVHSTSTGFLAAEERTSFETEELSEDNEPQIASEELIESAQEDEEEAQIESEESAEAIEDEEEAQMPEAIQEHDAVQIESKESSDLVEKNDEIPIQESELIQDVQVKSEESPASIGRKLRKQRKTPTNRTSTSRVPTNRPSTNRVSTRRAAKTNLVTSSNLSSTDATTSSSSSSNSPSSNSPSSNSPSSNSSLSSSSSTSSSPSTPPSSNPSLTSPLNSSTPDSSASNPIETTSAIAPMLPNKRLWKWASKPNHTSGGNQYYTAIRRGRETINIGDSVLFYSYKPNEKPYIGKIVQLWSKKSEMKVKCDWFYRPEELHEPCGLNPPGGLFTSDHRDTNDVQTISHKVMVVTLDEYKQMLEKTPQRHQRICEDDTYYYNAGYYKNPKMKLATGVKTIPIQIDNK
ncbi:platelet binding protein GspB isoform X1 [Linepithema humile]|uniref:platelet binding protein GspB isoform X1 n=2 Tax=Linepithema humile TaxID=83485 RepID=UPI00351F340D